MDHGMMEAMQKDAANLAEGKPPGAPRPAPTPLTCADCGTARRVLRTIEADGRLPLCPRCFNERDAEGCF